MRYENDEPDDVTTIIRAHSDTRCIQGMNTCAYSRNTPDHWHRCWMTEHQLASPLVYKQRKMHSSASTYAVLAARHVRMQLDHHKWDHRATHRGSSRCFVRPTSVGGRKTSGPLVLRRASVDRCVSPLPKAVGFENAPCDSGSAGMATFTFVLKAPATAENAMMRAVDCDAMAQRVSHRSRLCQSWTQSDADPHTAGAGAGSTSTLS